MNNLIVDFRKLPYEQKVIIITTLGICFSTLLTCGKFIIGLFSNYNLCIIAIYTLALILGKIQCVLGAKAKSESFSSRNLVISIFLFISSAVYIAFMVKGLFTERKRTDYGIAYVCIIALIAFLELGFSIAGIIRTKNKGHYYRDIKIINFCIALTAILTTQVTILDFTATTNVDVYNSAAGIGIGAVIALCAVYILVAPRISLVDREHNAFALKDNSKNHLVSMGETSFETDLCKSIVYGTYRFRAAVSGDCVEGDIVLGDGIWKNMHLFWKILCCILSEILLPVWLIGRFIFFLRSANLPKKLETEMVKNGFQKI